MKKKITTIILGIFSFMQISAFADISSNENKDFNEYVTNDIKKFSDRKDLKDEWDDQRTLYQGGLLGLGVKRLFEDKNKTKKDKKIEILLDGYSFEDHNKYMTKLSESVKVKKEHKTLLISLLNTYYKYRKDLDKNILKKIYQAPKPKIQYFEQDLDLTLTPYMNNTKIEKWVRSNYEKTSDYEFVLDAIYEYKQSRQNADKELERYYLAIITS